MKRLLLLRHAKSSWDEGGVADHDRPLAARGRRAAPAVAEHMASAGLVPEHVLCSTAARARETWALMAPVLGEDVPVEHRRDLYGAEPADLLDAVRHVGEDVERLLLVGHNPAMESLAHALAGTGRRKAMERMQSRFPTGALAVIRFDVATWGDVAPERGELERFVRPRDVERA